MTVPDHPDPMSLWQQAGGGTKDYDPGRYRELLHEAGMILHPGDAGYKDAPRNLPCGWPGSQPEVKDEDVTFRDDPAPARRLDDWEW